MLIGSGANHELATDAPGSRLVNRDGDVSQNADVDIDVDKEVSILEVALGRRSFAKSAPGPWTDTGA